MSTRPDIQGDGGRGGWRCQHFEYRIVLVTDKMWYLTLFVFTNIKQHIVTDKIGTVTNMMHTVNDHRQNDDIPTKISLETRPNRNLLTTNWFSDYKGAQLYS